MQVGDNERTTKGRYFLNTYLLPRMASILNNGCEVLFVGTDTSWDYKPLFWSPAKQCPYVTMDKAERYNPDIVASIESCPEVQDNRFALVIMIGVYEFLDHKAEAFAEINRILTPGGYLMCAFPGKGYYPDNRGVAPEEVYGILKDYRVLEVYNLYEGKEEPNSVCVVAQKK
jgi:SAM-dependent methyltransferase